MKELIEGLKNYKSWLSGDDTVPQEVGEMIDEAIDALEKGAGLKELLFRSQATNPLIDLFEFKNKRDKMKKHRPLGQ